MKTLLLPRNGVYAGSLRLVNGPVPMQTKDESDLVPAIEGFPDILLHRQAAANLQVLLRAIGAGGEIVPVSGYRSAQEQTDIYQTSLAQSGEVFTRRFVALPYHSEHQTGLAIDLAQRQADIDFICPAFPNTGVCGAFRKAAPAYGFIERYPAGKEAVTGISHEPWHFRYIGTPHAAIMTQKGLTLEEYLILLHDHPWPNRPLVFQEGEAICKLGYLPAKESGPTVVSFPENAAYTISGDNQAGFIVTCWEN